MAVVPVDTDHDLVAQFERDALPLVDLLYRAACRLTDQPSEAEELVAAAFSAALAGFGSFHGETSLRAWLCRILTETAINSSRSRLPQPIPTPSCIDLAAADVEALAALPCRTITAMLDQLPVELRMPVYYADFEGMRYREIAYILDTSRAAIPALLRRGRAHLRISISFSIRRF